MVEVKILVLNGKILFPGLIGDLFQNPEVHIFETGDFSEFTNLLENFDCEIAVLDISGLGDNECNVIRRIRTFSRNTEVMIITEQGRKQMKSSGGVTVFNGLKNIDDIRIRIEETAVFGKLLRYNNQLDQNLEIFSKEIRSRGGREILGSSKAIKSIASLILLVSRAEDTSVMITGESGTGKELVARAIHLLSTNKGGQFNAVNCSAIPDSLFESEFFGYRKGAFTGAEEKSAGWFEVSDNGTLFLDEITELPVCMQSKLLRVLDEKTVHRIGSHQEVKLNLRIISATNQDVRKLISEKKLREDLYHRLDSFHIHIPPLRERREDIPYLADHFVEYFSARMHKHVKGIEDKVMDRMTTYSFPGNVRELKNMIESAVILSEDKVLLLKDFNFRGSSIDDINSTSFEETTSLTRSSLKLSDIEKKAILEALNRSKNNKSKAARLLSISRQSLDRRLIRFRLS